MINNDALVKIADTLLRANDVAIYCHTSPDGDTISSSLAVYTALKKLGKNVNVFCDQIIPKKYFCLKNAEVIKLPDGSKHDVSLSMDCAGLDRLGKCVKQYSLGNVRIAVDHHKTFDRFCDLYLLDIFACSVAQMTYFLLNRMQLIDKDIAGLLFAGIVTDSGCFAYSNVTTETHEVAAKLMGYGIDASKIIYDVFRSTEVNKFRLKCRVLSKCEFYDDNKIALIVFNKEDYDSTDTDHASTEGIISELIEIDSVQVAYAFSETEKLNYKVSIRTKEGVDASDIAMTYGGGGHQRAAGCRANGYIEDIKEKFLKNARDRIQ